MSFPIKSCVVALIAVALGFYISRVIYFVPEVPRVDMDRWWGVGEKPAAIENKSIRPFKIEFSDTMIKDLKERLQNRRPITTTLEGIQSQYGTNSEFLETILEYWQTQYNFTERAKLLNMFAHYKTNIQGLDIHFVRKMPSIRREVKVLPILLLHGWPSSLKEFDNVIPLLAEDRDEYDFVFDVVAADLPGFGFSQGTTKPGLSPDQIAVIMHNLMMRLGFDKYMVHAGDWGAQVASCMIKLFSDDIIGHHTNFPISSMPITIIKTLFGALYPPLVDEEKYAGRLYPLSSYMEYILRESGYFHLQATKPDSIGVALSDSPAGLAAYLIEKIAVCTNRDSQDTLQGGLQNLDIDDVLDTVTIMWVNNCVVTSMRIYAEGLIANNPIFKALERIPTEVPTAVIKFKYEVIYQPDTMLRDKYKNLVQSTKVEYGGHFAAMEYPKLLADDIFEGTVQILNHHAQFFYGIS